MQVPRPKAELATPQPQQQWIRATSATYAATFINTWSLTHWARPGIDLTSSQIPRWVLNPLSHNGNAFLVHFYFEIFKQTYDCDLVRADFIIPLYRGVNWGLEILISIRDWNSTPNPAIFLLLSTFLPRIINQVSPKFKNDQQLYPEFKTSNMSR